MDSWFLLLILSLGIAALFKAIPGLMSSPLRQNRKLPPGPLGLPFISDFFWVRKSLADLEPILRALHAKHGPVVALHQGGSPAIFVASHALAHHALVQSGATFADRPPTGSVETMLTSNQRKINSARYGPMWRLLRRNLTAEILHPTRVRSYSPTRERVLEILLERLRADEQDRPVVHFQYAMFCLLVLMCFGDGLKERQIREVEEVQRGMLLNLGRFEILNMWPRLGKVLFRRRWEEFYRIRHNQEDVLLPLIRARSEARTKAKEAAQDKDNGDRVICYVDTLLDLELPEEKRKLKEDEILHLCSEFLNGGTDTTYTALQWIMANIVKYPAVQDTLYDEIRAVIGPGAVLVEEEDLQRLPYLKAVVLEGLRRHPPAHFVLPHAVTEDTELGGYLVPRKGTVNFMVAEMGWDPKVWEDPLAFRPERFLSNSPESGGGVEGFDITGSREIRMMPFGAGRRMCPGYALALLHLEYFVGNLVSAFEWKPVEGDGVDLSEKQEFTVVMKNPLEAILIPRSK
ncbi:cytochrome P450 89A2-like [Punica granatum]|nr:cytochrome P450 89A2-like [Punica granatum]